MAADMKARQDKHSTIAFTLPISCQVCLGKVKQPVLCPNNHVFCSVCMDVWLQRNQQCPACRVTISPANPVKKILGGLNEVMDDKDRLSNPELRKARFDILYKEYEEEFEKLHAENNLLKTENNILKQQLQRKGSDGKTSSRDVGLPKTPDTNGLLLLTKKLQDAQRLYEKVKTELSRTKEENSTLKEENVNLNHENQKLRAEVANRSPHRYGRYTVSTLEAKIQSYEKEVSQLNKALEKSDKYIEEMQSELEGVRSKEKGKTDALMTKTGVPARSTYTRYLPPDPPLTTGYDTAGSHKRQLFSEEGSDKKTGIDGKSYVNGESHKYDSYDNQLVHDRYKSYETKPSSKSNSSKNGTKAKRVTFDLPKDKSETMSFDLEMPSPMTSKLSLTNGSTESPIKGVLKNGKKSSAAETSDSFNLSKPGLLDDSLLDTHKKPVHRYSKDDDDLFGPRSSRGDLNETFSLDHPDKNWKTSDRHDHDFDDTQVIQSELDELDISLTPDFTECMKLLNRAEKKVHSHEDEDDMDSEPLDVYRSSQNGLGEYRSKSDPLSQDYEGKDDLKTYYKSDPLKQDFKGREDFKSYSKPDSVGTRLENTYSSKYYPSHLEDNFKPSASSKSSHAGSQGDTELLGNKYRTSQSEGDLLGSKYKTSLSGGRNYISDLDTKADSDQYSLPASTSVATAVGSERYSLPTDSYAGGDDIDKYRPKSAGSELLLSQRTTTSSRPSSAYSLSSSTLPNKFSLSGKSLSQSGFGRSPSVDNLFISPKSSRSTGSRFATAEDIPSFKSSRLSLPNYPSNTSSSNQPVGKFSSASYEPGRKGRVSSGTMSDIGINQEYSAASLPPRPIRTRSYSDMGSTVGAYPVSVVNQGKGSTYDSVVSTSTTHMPDTLLDTSDDISAPPYVVSSVTQPVHVSAVSSMYTSQPVSVTHSHTHASHRDPGFGVLRSGGGGDANNTDAIAFNTASIPSSTRSKPKFSYTDVDLGVNPRNKAGYEYKSAIRTRSSSLDVPVSKIMSNANQLHAVSSNSDHAATASNMNYSSEYLPVAVANSDVSDLPFAGTSARSSLESAYPNTSSRFAPAPVSSSTSTTSYLPTSLTSITASTTYSMSHPPSSSTYPASSLSSSAYPPSTLTSTANAPPTTSYTRKPLDLDNGARGGFSYLSNNSSLGEFSKSDSYLPEPKKRLFESSDDLDVSLSPIKATRKM